MAWIQTLEDPLPDSEHDLRRLHERARDPSTGRVDHILAIHSLHPAGLAAHLDLYEAVMRGTQSLPTVEREMIALLVSQRNACHYWITHHRRGLRRLLKDDALLERIEADFETAGLDPRRLAILRYAAKLTDTPAAVTQVDVQSLRDQNLTDTDILQVAEVTAYYAYVNRIADGLGVELEPESP